MQKCDTNRRRRNSFHVALLFQRGRTFIILTISSAYFSFDTSFSEFSSGVFGFLSFCFFSMVAFYICSNLWNLEKCVQRAAFSSYFLVDKELAMPENNEGKKKIFKSSIKLFEPQRKFMMESLLTSYKFLFMLVFLSQIPLMNCQFY